MLSAVSFDSPVASYAAGDGPCSVTAADLNGDGAVELIAANYYSNNVSILRNLGNGTYAPQVPYAVGNEPWSVAAADVNGDGAVDLITANRRSNTVSVLRNLGNGTFAAQVSYAVGREPYFVTAADVNGDGAVDLITANATSNSISFLRNLGNGTYASQVTYAVGNRPSSVAVADVDEDGAMDLITANMWSNTVSVLRNLGNGTFAAQVSYAVGDGPTSIAVVDVNGDGAEDLVTANGLSDTVSVLRNLGNGTFAAQVTYTVGDGPRHVATADLDRDGVMDLITANMWSNTVSVLRNLGNATFAAQVTYAVGDNPLFVTPADVNRDGAVDLVTADRNSDTISVLINTAESPHPEDDTLATAQDLGTLAAGQPTTVSGRIGWGTFTTDVDMVRFRVSQAGTVDLKLTTWEPQGTFETFESYLRLFDSGGRDMAASRWFNESGIWSGSRITTYLSPGTYYAGISGSPNRNYSPWLANKGVLGDDGTYRLEVSIESGSVPTQPPPEPVGSLQVQSLGGTPTQRPDGSWVYSNGVLINDILEITSTVYVDTDFTIRGNGTLSVANTAIYTGAFSFPAGAAATAAMNKALSTLKVAGLDVHIDRLTLLVDGVKVEGAIALPNDMGDPKKGGVRVDFSGENYVALKASGLVYDIDVTASNVDLDLEGFHFECSTAELLLSNTSGSHVGELTGEWDVNILGTPVHVNLSKNEGNYFRFDTAGTWDLNGSLTVGRINFIPNKLYTEGFYIDVDTSTRSIYGEGSIRLPIGDGVRVFAHAGISHGYFDNAGIEVQGMDVLIWDKPPIYLDRISGDVWHLTPDHIDGKTTVIEIGAGFQLFPDMGEYNLLYLDLDGYVDLGGGIGGTAALKVGKLEDPIASGTVGVDWRWTGDSYLRLHGSILVGSTSNPYLVVNGGLNAASNKVTGRLTGQFHRDALPSAVAWTARMLGVGETMQVDAYAQIINDKNPTNDFLMAGVENLFSIRVDLVDDFKLSKNVHVGGYKLLVPYLSKDAAKVGGTPGISMETYELADGTTTAIFELSWETGDADFELTAPDGTTYTPANVENYANVSFGKFPEEGKAIFFVESPDGGLWQATVNDQTEDGNAVLSVSVNDSAPTINILAPVIDTSDSTVAITWTDEDADSDATVRLYYDTDRDGVDGVLIADGISENDATDAYTWDTSGVPTGDYYVYAVIDDGVNLPAISYGTGRVSVVDPEAPEPVTGLSSVEAGDDWVRLTWDPSAATDLDHYLIRYTAEAGGEFYETTVSSGSETSYVLGARGDENITPGTTYRATVAAVDAQGHISVDATPVVFTIGTPTADVFAKPGAALEWQIPAESGATFLPISLPQGAWLVGDGLVEWNVPSDVAPGWHEMLVFVIDTAGEKDVWRRFVLVDDTAPVMSAETVRLVDATTTSLEFTVPSATDTAGSPWYQLRRGTTVVATWQQGRTFKEEGLAPNTTYAYQVQPKDNRPVPTVGNWSDSSDFTTLAAVPETGVFDMPTPTGVTLVSLEADTNPAGTRYAVLCSTNGLYVGTNGVLGQSAVWLVSGDWAGTVIEGLAPDRVYEFQLLARNSEGVVTEPGEAVQVVTDREKDAPTVTGRQVSVDGSVRVVFSEPVYLYLSDIALLDADESEIETDGIEILQTPGGNEATVDLSGVDLTFGETYTVRLRGDRVQDFAANLLDGAANGTPGTDYDIDVSITMPGDLNGDRAVASADLDIVRANWGQTVTTGDLSSGDANWDGVVNSGDLDMVRANWGASSVPTAASARDADEDAVFPSATLIGPRQASASDAALASLTDSYPNQGLSDTDLASLAQAAWLREVEGLRSKGKRKGMERGCLSGMVLMEE